LKKNIFQNLSFMLLNQIIILLVVAYVAVECAPGQRKQSKKKLSKKNKEQALETLASTDSPPNGIAIAQSAPHATPITLADVMEALSIVEARKPDAPHILPCVTCSKKLEGKSWMCSSCKTTYYCSEECQAIDWKTGGHKVFLFPLKQRRRYAQSYHLRLKILAGQNRDSILKRKTGRTQMMKIYPK
jgi:hypothetical protein